MYRTVCVVLLVAASCSAFPFRPFFHGGAYGGYPIGLPMMPYNMMHHGVLSAPTGIIAGSHYLLSRRKRALQQLMMAGGGHPLARGSQMHNPFSMSSYMMHKIFDIDHPFF